MGIEGSIGVPGEKASQIPDGDVARQRAMKGFYRLSYTQMGIIYHWAYLGPTKHLCLCLSGSDRVGYTFTLLIPWLNMLLIPS